MFFYCTVYRILVLSVLVGATGGNLCAQTNLRSSCPYGISDNVYVQSERDQRMLESICQGVESDTSPYTISGTGRFVVETAPERIGKKREVVDLFVEDVSIETVLNFVVAEVFKADYVLPPDLEAGVTIQINAELTLDEFISKLNTVLFSQDVYLTIKDDIVTAVSFDGRRGIQNIAVAPSESMSAEADALVYDLKYVPAETLVRTLEPLFGNNSFKSFVNERGLLTVKGDSRSITLAQNIINALDVPFLSSANFELVKLTHSKSSDILKQIETLLEQTALLSVIDIPDANAILLVAKTKETISHAKKLLSLVDVPAHINSQTETWYYKAVFAEAEHLKEVLNQGLRNNGSANIRVDKNTGILAISGPVQFRQSTLDHLQMIDVPPSQVSIEVTVAEITLIDEFRFGIQWEALLGELSVRSQPNLPVATDALLPGLTAAYVGSNLSTILNLLDTKTQTEVISSPHIMTYDRQTANISIGVEVPVQIQQAVGVQTPDSPIVTTTEYRQTGVDLEVTPKVRGNQIIEINLKQEISDIVQSGLTEGEQPRFSTKRIENTFMVPSGTTIAIGGLLGLRNTDSDAGVPGLKNIPFLGRAFGNEAREKTKTELVLLVRPTIMNYYDIAQNVQNIGNNIQNARQAGVTKLDQRFLDAMIE